MIQCQHCGQVNSAGSNFCRFCGLKYNQPHQINQENRTSYEYSPPRPYSWKTDELELQPEKQTKPINQVRPLVSQPPQPTRKDMPIPFHSPAQFQQNIMSYENICPRCSSQAFPRIEKKISTTGWIVFAVLLMTIFPLFWIGLLIKEEVRVCPVCDLRIKK
ncbi:MAG: LITAF-like zinc ribbon domain-containing protein [Aridibacter sp.]